MPNKKGKSAKKERSKSKKSNKKSNKGNNKEKSDEQKRTQKLIDSGLLDAYECNFNFNRHPPLSLQSWPPRRKYF